MLAHCQKYINTISAIKMDIRMEQMPSSVRLRCKKSENTDKVFEKEDEGLKNTKSTQKKQSKQSIDSIICIFIILLSTLVILHRSKTISTDVLFDFKVKQQYPVA